MIMNLEGASAEDQMRHYADLAKTNDENCRIMNEFMIAAAPIVERLKKWGLEADGHYKICDKVREVWTDGEGITEHMYTIRVYDPVNLSGGIKSPEDKPREPFGFEINFYQNGAVIVQKYFNDRDENGLAPKKRRTERLYKANLRRFDFGWFGLGKIMPEKIDENGIAFAVRRGLVSSWLLKPLPV
jgi:hypothetical protein